MVEPIVSIIIPTWNNPQFLDPCVSSILKTGVLQSQFAELILVNNGKQPLNQQYSKIKGIKVIDAGDNLGWTGGIKLGLEQSAGKFICFQNDDTFIPKANMNFYHRLLMPFQHSDIGAVGPATTCAAGLQSSYHPSAPVCPTIVKWLIFFTVMIRKDYILEAGGIDDTMKGGDDFDLCMRLRKIGKKLLINPDAFIIHHGFKTGTRVFGESNVDGGWNSITMSDNTNKELIHKHGFESFIETMHGQFIETFNPKAHVPDDSEGKLIAESIKPEEKTLELACGARKTVSWAYALDKTPKGEPVSLLADSLSVADQVADVTEPLPFEDSSFDAVIARHILEHCLDPIKVLKQWAKVLKPSGRMYIAVPNEAITRGIPLSPDHCHAFDQNSLTSVARVSGLEPVLFGDPNNGCSFIAVFEKAGIPCCV